MNSVFPNRRNARLRGYDYTSEGLYFVTICTYRRRMLFGHVVAGEMRLNRAGSLVNQTWKEMFGYEEEPHPWVVMPNHVHGLIAIAALNSRIAEPRKSLGRLVAAFKTVSSKRVNQMRNTAGEIVWQRNFYEHIVRSERSLQRIADYIAQNPANWLIDSENPMPIADAEEPLRR